MTDGTVSVVIPCYNAAPFVGEAIESALSQAARGIEVVVVDDGSVDDTPAVLESFGDHIRVERQENRGAAAARNLGLTHSTGRFVKFLDADDVLVPDAIEGQLRDMGEENLDSRHIVFGDVGRMDSAGESRCSARYGSVPESTALEDWVLQLLTKNISTLAPLHRRDFLERIGGFDATLRRWDEYDLHLRLLLSGVRFRYRARLVAYARMHSGEDRISNHDPLRDDPMYGLRMLKQRMGMLEVELGSPLPYRIRRHISRQLWRRGRIVLAYGQPLTAGAYFDEASSLCAGACVEGGAAYTLAVKLLGWRIVEKCAAMRRSLMTG